MRNPIRKISDILGYDAESDINSQNNPYDVKAVRTVSKLWILGFGAMAALIGNEVIQEGGLPTMTIEPSDAKWEIIEFGLDTVLAAGVLIPESIAVAGCAEFVRIHRIATKRLEELQPPIAG